MTTRRPPPASLPSVPDSGVSDHAESLPFAHDTVELHVVRVADALCERLGIGPFANGELGAAGEQSAEHLGLDDDRIEYFALQLESIRKQIQDLL